MSREEKEKEDISRLNGDGDIKVRWTWESLPSAPSWKLPQSDEVR